MEVEEFIKEVMERPGIWMSQHPYYKFNKIKLMLWAEVQQLFPNYNIVALKKKWKSLYDVYRRELRKVTNVKDPLAPEMTHWKHFELIDSFLRTEITNVRQTVCLPDGGDAKELEDCVIKTSQSPENRLLESRTPSPNVPEYASLLSETEEVLDPKNSENAQKNMRRSAETALRKRLKRKAVRTNDICRQRIKLEQSLPGSTQALHQGDYYFLMSLLPEIEKLPTVNRIRLRNKFISALLEEINDGQTSGEVNENKNLGCV